MLFFEGSSSTSHGRKQDPLLIKMQESAAKPNNSHDFFFFFKCTVAVLVTKQCSTHMSSCHACILIYSYAELMLSNLC